MHGAVRSNACHWQVSNGKNISRFRDWLQARSLRPTLVHNARDCLQNIRKPSRFRKPHGGVHAVTASDHFGRRVWKTICPLAVYKKSTITKHLTELSNVVAYP